MKKDEPVYFLYFSLELGNDVLLAKLMGLYCAEEFGIYLTLNELHLSTIFLEDAAPASVAMMTSLTLLDLTSYNIVSPNEYFFAFIQIRIVFR